MKVGRNDPCHCGSGQKYKKCCLAKDDAARAAEVGAPAEPAPAAAAGDSATKATREPPRRVSTAGGARQARSQTGPAPAPPRRRTV